MSDVLLPHPNEIRHFPRHPRARLRRIGNHLYVTLPAPGGGRRICGKVIDGTYWDYDEYRHTFRRDGTRRDKAPSSRLPRTSQTRTPLAPKPPLPDPKSIENFPDVPGARLLWIRRARNAAPVLYVVKSQHRRFNGKSRGLSEYLGRIHENRFYSLSEYGRLFKRDGSRRELP